MESHFTEYLQERIHYLKAGKGPGVILLHGLGETSVCWNNQTQFLLNKGFQLIIPDFPGSGKSTLNAPEDLTIEKMAMIVHHIIIQEKLLQPALLGHSMGGYVALKYLQLFPNDIGALGLIHSTAYADTAEKKAVRNKSISFINQHGIEAYLPASISSLFKDENLDLAKELLEEAADILGNTIIQYHRAIMAREEQVATLKNCITPILIISGKYDHTVPFTDSLAQSHLALLTSFHLLKQSSHMGHWEESEEVNKILVDFLKRD